MLNDISNSSHTFSRPETKQAANNVYMVVLYTNLISIVNKFYDLWFYNVYQLYDVFVWGT